MFDIKRNPTWQGMQMVQHAYRQLARGKVTLVLVGGDAGIGKTWELRATCRVHLIKHVPEERPENDSGLIQCVWINRECEVLAHNECDHLFQSPRSMNVLKLLHEEPRMCALATKEAERNQYLKDRESVQYNPAIPPPKFYVGKLCRQAFTVNEDYTDPKVTAKLPQKDWQALIRRGLDPIYVPVAGRDGLDLFEFTYHKATEGKMLRALQFDWDASRQAINFYVQNIDRLVDISSARLEMIARQFRDTPNRLERKLNLNRMLAAVSLRPNLKLEHSHVQVLLWPTVRPNRGGKSGRSERPPRRVQPTQSRTNPASHGNRAAARTCSSRTRG